MQFNNLKIGAKIIIAMVFVGAIGVGATVLTAVQLHDVDATYSDLLERRSKAILDTARASRAANDVLAQAYKVIAYPANSAGESAGRTQIEQSYTTSLDLLKRSAVLIPALQSDYDSVSKQISDLKLGVDKAIEFGRRDENEKALLVMDEVDGQLRAVVGRITALNDNLSKDTEHHERGTHCLDQADHPLGDCRQPARDPVWDRTCPVDVHQEHHRTSGSAQGSHGPIGRVRFRCRGRRPNPA